MSDNNKKDIFENENENISLLRKKYGVIQPRLNDEEAEITEVETPDKKKSSLTKKKDKQEPTKEKSVEPDVKDLEEDYERDVKEIEEDYEPDIIPFSSPELEQKKDFTTPSMRIIYQDSDSDHVNKKPNAPAMNEHQGGRIISENDNEEVFPFPEKAVDKRAENKKNNEKKDKLSTSSTEDSPTYIDDDQLEESNAPLKSWAKEDVVDKDEPSGLFKQLLMETFPWKGDSSGEILRKMVMLTAVLILIGCSAYFGDRFAQARESDNLNAELIGMVTESSGESSFWEDMREKYPSVVFPQGLQPKFAELYAINPDFAGWLKIDNTDIDIPLLQGGDNSKYLRMDYYGNTTRYGNPFVDYRNNLVTLDRNTIIYGHYMRDGRLFSRLKKYMTIDGYKEAPVIEFDTPTKDYKWKVYAVFVSNGFASGDNGYVFNYIFTNLNSDSKFMEYINEIDQRKLYTTGVDILPTDKILTLSTCNYEFNEARLVVVARLLRDGESENVETYKILINPNPRYPQAWYDKRGLTNPYKNFSKWTPD